MDVRTALDTITADAARGDGVFPTHADVALRVRRAVDDPDCSIEHLARLIQAEPLLAARVVALANSAAYGSGGRGGRAGRDVSDPRSAVPRIGFRAVRALATGLVVRQMQDLPREATHRQLAARLWEHTVEVAALAHVIAGRVTRQDPDTAFFAGIVHEVGGFYLISRAAAFPGLLEGGLADWSGDWEARVGRAVLDKLAVPEAVAAAVEALWAGFLAMPPASLGDTLLLADELAATESPLGELAGMGRGGTTVDIDLALDDATLSGVLRESAEELQSLKAALAS